MIPEGAILSDFFVVGAMKAGTTSVAEILSRHPDVYACPVKEPHFFADDIEPDAFAPAYRRTVVFDAADVLHRKDTRRIHHAFVRDGKTYAKLFEASSGAKVAGEFSTSYLYSPRAAANIRARIPQARIVVLLRDPLERAFSHYLMDRRIGLERRPFRAAVQADLAAERRDWGMSPLYLDLGLYSVQVARYLESFPRDQLLILLYDDLRDDFAGALARICHHLGVDPAPVCDESVHANPASQARLPALNALLHRVGAKRMVSRSLPRGLVAAAKRLYYAEAGEERLTAADRDYFLPCVAPDIERLESLLGRDLSHWRR